MTSASELKRPPLIRKLLSPVEQFIQAESASGFFLMAFALAAFVLANSVWSEHYFGFKNTVIRFSVGGTTFATTIQHFVNDGLMTIFFMTVALEIKRELIIGELSDQRKALLPVVAAIGGMLVPALIFLAFNAGLPTSRGWAIPMATDIAFALGALALLGNRVPLSAKVFLASLAIIDDLGAILVIATFHTQKVALPNLAGAAICLAAMFLLNRTGVRNTWAYFATGLIVWILILYSGVHPTIAGVLIATTIPTWSKIAPQKFQQLSAIKLRQLNEATKKTTTHLVDKEQEQAIYELQMAVKQIEPPAAALLRSLHPWSTFIIMPIFAFCNAGVDVRHGGLIINQLSLGIIAGLLVGKPLGIMSACYLFKKASGAETLNGLSLVQLLGISILAAIGFTMSLFIVHLSFTSAQPVHQATLSVLSASLIALIAGSIILRLPPRQPSKQQNI